MTTPLCVKQRQTERTNAAARILVVDDDPGIRGVLERFLSERNYRVATAVDGGEAMETLRNDPPDVVLLDLQMPKLSGLDVLRRIQTEGIEVATIALSGHPAGEEYLGPDSLKLGATEFIVKPFDLEDLETRLVNLLEAINVG